MKVRGTERNNEVKLACLLSSMLIRDADMQLG